MKVSTHIVGIKPPDEKWKKMKAVYDACVNAGINIPMEVSGFFGHEQPDDNGVVLCERQLGDCVSEYGDSNGTGFEVDVSKIPEDVRIIRFVSYW